MKPTRHLLPATRPGALLRLFALMALVQVPFAPRAAALSPQDSTHAGFVFEKLSGETQWYNAQVANQRVYYTTDNYGGGSGPGAFRARNFSGELVFEYTDPQAQAHHGYAISADGRLYHFINGPQQYQLRVAIVSPGGVRLADFGPHGRGEGVFGSGGGGTAATPDIAISPVTGRIYISDESIGSQHDSTKKGLVRVFDREGNFLHEFRTTGILATTLEGDISRILVRGDAQGADEVFVVDVPRTSGSPSSLKVFGGDGQFRRIVTGGKFSEGSFLNTAVLWEDRLIFSGAESIHWFAYVAPAGVVDETETLAKVPFPGGRVIGVHGSGGLIVVNGGGSSIENLQVQSYPNFSNFDASARNAVPNPWVLKISQRPGGGIVDIDYRVDDLDDSSATTALLAFADGVASLTNALPVNTLIEGTASKVGANQPTGTVQRVTWNAGTDWNVDFGTLRVMALARDSRSHWFDTHLVEIPADGDRPAVTISRNPLRQQDFLAQFLWLVATKDPSVRLTDGVLFGTTGADNGVILANGTASTAEGRAFLLKRDGLRVATAAEVTRAREGATPGFEVKLAPPLQMVRTHPSGSFPNSINEYGIESGNVGASEWYVVRDSVD